MLNTLVGKSQIKFNNNYLSLSITLNNSEISLIYNNKNFTFSLPQFLFNFKDKNYIAGEVSDYKNSIINVNIKNDFENVNLSFKYKDILNCELNLKFYLTAPLLEYNFQVTNITNEEININKFYLLGKKNLNYPFKLFTKFYKSGYQSWSPTYIKDLNQKDDLPPLKVIHNILESSSTSRNKKFLRSENFTVLMANNIQMLLGFTTAEKLFSYLEIDNNNLKIQAVSETYNGKLISKQALSSEKFLIAFAEDANDLFNLYADKIKENLNIKLNKEILLGWCSWYYYYTKVSESELLKNLNILKQNQSNIKIKLFQLDDGYQQSVGDWLKVNKKFPRGLKALAGTIKRAGFTAGIWLAPFVVRPTADIFKQHPDWILKNNDKNVIAGQNPAWGTQDWGYYYALDLSHPQVLNYLKNVFTTLSEFGFKFFKLDFIFAGCLAGEHYDKNKTNVEIYRDALKIIREATGEDSFLLGCGAPLLPSAGLVDGMRIGTDVDPSWEHWLKYLFGSKYTMGLRPSLGNAVSRNFYNGKVWINDPECFMLRKTKTRLSNKQKLFLLTLTTLLGGLHLNSDNISEFGSDEFQLWEKTNPHFTGKVEVIDWNINKYPQQILVRGEEESFKLILLNWDKTFTTQHFDIGERFAHKFHIFDFWNEKYLSLSNGSLNVFLPATSCKVLFLTKASENFPVIVGNTFHLWQEKVFNISLFSDKKFMIKVNLPAQRKGKIYLQLPAKLQNKNYLVQSNAKIKRNYKLNKLLVLEFTTTNDTYLTINLE